MPLSPVHLSEAGDGHVERVSDDLAECRGLSSAQHWAKPEASGNELGDAQTEKAVDGVDC